MDPRVTRIIATMEKFLDRPISLEELAALVHLSPSRMAHLFKQHTGTPPARYLHQLRLSRARLLLERTSLSVKQVIGCVGLHDPSHFSRDFRREHGESPSDLRARTWAARRAGEPTLQGREEPPELDLEKLELALVKC
jgi:transcriptional regulator GlxA family with amidase domain